MLIKGSDLTAEQRKQVLNAFVHRNTVEHPTGTTKLVETDAGWLNRLAFYFVKDGSRLAANRRHAEPWYLAEKTPTEPTSITCPQCNLVRINGMICHETGCPNTNARYDSESGEWIKQRKCFECGCLVDVTDPCCNEPFED